MPIMNNRVYLAGPDVFFPDALQRAEHLKKICRTCDMEGVFPLDVEIKSNTGDKRNMGCLINLSNLHLIETCRGVLANISPFRGPSVDAGTAFEIGYAKALGKIIVAYTDDLRPYKERVTPDGLDIEDFGMIDNLMIDANILEIFRTPEEAAEFLACNMFV